MVGKEALLGHFRFFPVSFAENSWSRYCPSWSRLKWECSENIRLAYIFAQSLQSSALTFTVLKPLKIGKITEFKIKTGD